MLHTPDSKHNVSSWSCATVADTEMPGVSTVCLVFINTMDTLKSVTRILKVPPFRVVRLGNPFFKKNISTCTEWHSYFQSHPHPLNPHPPPHPRPFPPVSKCSPLKRWCPICHMWAKRDHALLFSITEFSSCQLRWDRRRSRWVAVSAINQHEIFSFEYTHHLLLPLLHLLENTP